VLAHGYPWADDSKSDDYLIGYATEAVQRWTAFAAAHQAIVLAPAFGGQTFPGYRELAGGVGEFVNHLVDETAREHGLPGRFALHGHSAGGQFAGRYLVTHPGRLTDVILSAPSAFPAPDPTPWPHGMTGAPNPPGWLAAATEVPVTVLVGDRDTDPRPPEPGQQGTTRAERAMAWVAAMHRYARAAGQAPTVHLVAPSGLDHDEAAMALPAQAILARQWVPGWSGR